MVATLKIGLGASREEIVQQLRARGASGADELAEALGVTKQCVRKHLDVLEREGYVEHAAARGDRGRPAHVFRLTAKAEELFPKRYDLFAKSVLRQIGEVWGERGLNTIFCGCATEMVAGLKPQLEGLNFDARIRRLTELLRETGYEAEAERLNDGSYVLTKRLSGIRYLWSWVDYYVGSDCTNPPTAPAGCISESTHGTSSYLVKVVAAAPKTR